MLSKVLIFQGFREFGDCSPWRLECLFLIRKGRFLISFSNFGGRTFSHMLISTLLGKGVGATGKPGHFRTLFPFSVSGKTVVGLLLRRRPLYPTELRNHVSKVLIFQAFRGIGDCSPWSLGAFFANQEGHLLISFSNFGGRTFSHMLISTLPFRGIGVIRNSGYFRTLFRFQYPERR